MKSLAERLKTKAMMIAMGEKIAFGSDSELMLEAAKEIERLEAELAAGRNQQTIGYLEKHLIESGRKIQLCNLTKTRLWADSVPVYIAAGAQPVPEGWQIVPIEISESMYEAYHKADNAAWCQMGASHGASIDDIWGAMLAAAKESKCP